MAAFSKEEELTKIKKLRKERDRIVKEINNRINYTQIQLKGIQTGGERARRQRRLDNLRKQKTLQKRRFKNLIIKTEIEYKQGRETIRKYLKHNKIKEVKPEELQKQLDKIKNKKLKAPKIDLTPQIKKNLKGVEKTYRRATGPSGLVKAAALTAGAATVYGSKKAYDKFKNRKKKSRVAEAYLDFLQEDEMYLGALMGDYRDKAQSWRGPNIPYGSNTDRPNLIRKCMMVECPRTKINCLRKLRDQAAMNPMYQHRIDRYIDEITDTYEPTDDPGTIPGNEFKTSGVGEDTPVTEGRLRKAAIGSTITGATIFGAAQVAVVRKCRRLHPNDKAKFRRCFRRGGESR